MSILLVKTAPVLLLCSWICGGQVSLDDHSDLLYHQLVWFEVTFSKTTFLWVSILLVKTDLSFIFDNGVVDDIPDQIWSSGKLANQFLVLKNPHLESKIIKIGQETPEIWCFEIFLKKTWPPGTGVDPWLFWTFFCIFFLVHMYILGFWKNFLGTSNFKFCPINFWFKRYLKHRLPGYELL